MIRFDHDANSWQMYRQYHKIWVSIDADKARRLVDNVGMIVVIIP